MDTRNVRFARKHARGAIKPITLTVVAVVAALGVASWFLIIKPHQALLSADDAKHGPAVAANAGAPVKQLNTLSLNELLEQARTAMNQQRLIAPAGNNAFEFYLTVLQKQPGNQAAADALRETFPIAASNVEQVINQRDFTEAQREIDVLAKADPANFTLTILRSKLDAQRKTLDEEQQKKLDQQHQADLAAQKAAAEKTASEKAAADKAAADKLAAQQALVAQQQQQQQATERSREQQVQARAEHTQSEPQTASVNPAPAQAQVETRAAIPITSIRPRYPTTALRNSQEGWVDLKYTVNADGSVSGIDVVDAQPRHVFESAAIDALRHAKFSPAMHEGAAVSSQQEKRIEFKLGGAQ